MKNTTILYICLGTSSENRLDAWDTTLLKIVRSRYPVEVCNLLHADRRALLNKKWSLVLISDSRCFAFYKPLGKKVKKNPVLFISSRKDIGGYLAPLTNLAGVINLVDASLSFYGIPDEMQIRINRPVTKTADYYLYEDHPEAYRIVYCPTPHTIRETDGKVFSILKEMNVSVHVVTDLYDGVKDLYPSIVRLLPANAFLSACKRAHLVIASGQQAVEAMALCKTCIVLGDYGLGGLINSETYESLKNCDFRGRNGAVFGEYVPIELLAIEITKSLTHRYHEELNVIRKEIVAARNPENFKTVLYSEIDRILSLYSLIRDKKKRFSLKPLLTSNCKRPEPDGNMNLTRGFLHFGEIGEPMRTFLQQCDGLSSLQELVQRNGCSEEETQIIWENLFELWQEKFIVFNV